jgi:hypothetical protein
MAVFTAAAAAIATGLGFAATGLVAASIAFGLKMIATAVISSIIAKRSMKGASDVGTKQLGTRVQLPPATDNKIGVVYGSAYMKPIITDAKISTDQQTMWYVMTFSEAMDSDSIGTFSFGDMYWGDKKLVFDETDKTKVVKWINSDGTEDTKVAGLINVYFYRDGSERPTNTNQFAYQILSTDAISEPNRWDSTKKMSKLVFAIVKISYNQDANLTGIADITLEVTNSLSKPGSVIKDYLQNTRYGAGLNISKINVDSLAALDAYSDQTITYTPSNGQGTATSAKFRINGPVDTTQNFLSNIVDICESCDSWVQWNESLGQWSVVINRSYLDTDPNSTSLRQIDSHNIIGGIDLSPVDLNATFNSVEIQFPNTKIKDQPSYFFLDLAEFPNVQRSSNEPDNRLSIPLPYTNNIIQAQYIAARRLLQSREDLVINFTMDYSGIQIDAGDVVGIHHERYGWGKFNELQAQPNGKLFRVTQVQEIVLEDSSLVVSITASEYNNQVYADDNITLRDFTPELNTGISDPSIITTPDAPTITDINAVGNIPNFTVNCVVPTTGTTLNIEFWYGTGSDLDSGNYRLWSLESPAGSPQFAKGSTVSIKVAGLEADTYFWRVRAVGARAKSGFSAATSVVWDPEFISGVIGEDVIVNFAPPVIGVPRLGPNLVPQFQDIVPKAYGQAGGALVTYVDALTDADPKFAPSTWRIATTDINNYTTPGVVQLSNVVFTLTNITTTTDGGVQFPNPGAMNSSTAIITIPVRFKDAAGNVFNSPPSSAQLVFVDQGVQGPPGEDGVNPGFIDLTFTAGGFRKGTDTFYTPTDITIQVVQQNILNPIALWSVIGATTLITTTEFPNDTITITPSDYDGFISVRVDVGLYNKSVTIPVVEDGQQGAQGIPGEFAGRGFIPLAYIPINIDPTLATQQQLTDAWIAATTFPPILNDGGTFWYDFEDLNGPQSITLNLSYNGTQWIPAALQLSGNLIADGTITANQLNANAIFTNRLASTNNVDVFGSNIGPGYWLDGQSGNAYFGGTVNIGNNLNVAGLIQSAQLVSRVVDTDVIVPGAVTEGQRSFIEGTRLITRFDAQNADGTYAWTTGTRGLSLPGGVAITPKVSAAQGGRVFIEFSMTLYNANENNKNLIELWRAGSIIDSLRYIKLYSKTTFQDVPLEGSSKTSFLLGNPQPVGDAHTWRIFNSAWGSNKIIEGATIQGSIIFNQAYSHQLPDNATTAKYWAFGAGGTYALMTATDTIAQLYPVDGTVPNVVYGTVRETQSIYGGSEIPFGAAEYRDITENITAIDSFSRIRNRGDFTEGAEVYIGDSLGRIFWTKDTKLPTAVNDDGAYIGFPRPQVNAFAFTRPIKAPTLEFPANDYAYRVIACGNNGRLSYSDRYHRNWGADDKISVFPQTGPNEFDYATQEFSWSQLQLGSYNLNDVASNWSQTGPNAPGETGFGDNGRRVVAVGDFGSIWFSNDYGNTWSAVNSGTLENLKSVAARPYTTSPTGFQWIAVGETGTVLRSTNGIEWENTASLPSEEVFGGRTYTPALFDINFNSGSTLDYPTGFIAAGDDRVISIPITTSTEVTSVISNVPTSGIFWKRLWYLGSNASPFDNNLAPLGSRLPTPSATIGAVITDTNYIADPDNNLTYVYYLVAGNMDSHAGSFATNPYISVTEFKR